MLDICAKKEQEKWLKGKKTNLLTCELESMKTDGTTEAEASDFLHPFLQQVCEYSDDTIEKVLNPLRDLNEQYSGKFDKEVILLKRKLGVGCKVMFQLVLLLLKRKMPAVLFQRFRNSRRVRRNQRIWLCQ